MACRVLNPFDTEIDLATTEGRKLFKEGIKPLEEKYDGTAERATYFETKVIDASESRCWATISKIVMEGQDVDILKQLGKLTLTDLKEYTETIWTDGDVNNDETYQKQICHNMMGMFLIESITPALCQRAQAKKEQWFYEEHNTINGLVLYKILIGYGAIGSRADIDKNKRRLHALNLKAHNHDVQKMLNDFTGMLAQIKSKGETLTAITKYSRIISKLSRISGRMEKKLNG